MFHLPKTHVNNSEFGDVNEEHPTGLQITRALQLCFVIPENLIHNETNQPSELYNKSSATRPLNMYTA